MPASFNIEEATIGSIHAAMMRGGLTCRSLVEQYAERIRRYDGALRSVILVNPDALKIADDLDAAFQKKGFVGPLHGIPVLLKDNVETCDMPTTAGSKSLEGYMSGSDAFIVKKLKAAGAIIFAKVNLHEFAVWGETVSSLMGQTFNPYDLTRTPGGSSGGTGAAVAANFGAVGIGTDTINSIRSPSSACSLAGIRPTLGLVSRGGIVPYSLTQDTAGPLCRTVTDAARVLEAIVAYDPGDGLTAWSYGRAEESYTKFLRLDGIKGKKIGVLRSFFGSDAIHREVNEIAENCLVVLRRLGATIVEPDDCFDSGKLVSEVSLHLHDLKDHLDSYLSKLPANAKIHSLEDLIASGLFHPGIEENIRKAARLSTESDEYARRVKACSELKDRTMKLFADKGLDALIFPHQKRPVVPVGETQVDRNGVLGAVTGFPSVIVQGGFTAPTATAPIGVPVGMELLGRPFGEGRLLEIAYAFEQATFYRQAPRL